MKIKISSLTLSILSVALITHGADQMLRYAQESPTLPVANQATTRTVADCSYYQQHAIATRGGLGAIVEAEPRGVRIVSLLPGHAGEDAGLRLGDRIVRIDGESAVGRSDRWAITRLRGKIGTTTLLEVERGEGLWQRTFAVQVQRQNIETRYSVYSRLRDGELTVKVLWVDGQTSEQLGRHLAQISQGEVDKVVLDLQNLSYGNLQDVVDSVALFLPEPTVVGYLASPDGGDRGNRAELVANLPAMTDKLEAVVVGPYTARGGELFARALADNLKVEVRGKQTAGLGTMDRRTIRSRNGLDGVGTFELLDAKGKPIEGRPLKPSFTSWSSLLSPIPTGFR